MGIIARRHRADPAAPHVVICGAGFAGLSAVSPLTRAGLRVTLVDGHLYSTFQPLLYQVATAGLNPGDVAFPAGSFARRYGANYRHGELDRIDPASRQVTLTNGLELDYDYLIIAAGANVRQREGCRQAATAAFIGLRQELRAFADPHGSQCRHAPRRLADGAPLQHVKNR